MVFEFPSTEALRLRGGAGGGKRARIDSSTGSGGINVILGDIKILSTDPPVIVKALSLKTMNVDAWVQSLGTVDLQGLDEKVEQYNLHLASDTAIRAYATHIAEFTGLMELGKRLELAKSSILAVFKERLMDFITDPQYKDGRKKPVLFRDLVKAVSADLTTWGGRCDMIAAVGRFRLSFRAGRQDLGESHGVGHRFPIEARRRPTTP